jgi:hypothetical protein
MSAQPTATDWRSTILLDLAFFMRLPEKPGTDWRVRCPTAVAYRAAVNLITGVEVSVLPLPRMAADREGGVEFEWDSLQIGVSPTGSFEFLHSTPKGRSEEGPIGITRARQLIASLAR